MDHSIFKINFSASKSSKVLGATDESQVLDVLCKHLTKEFRILVKEEATGDIKE